MHVQTYLAGTFTCIDRFCTDGFWSTTPLTEHVDIKFLQKARVFSIAWKGKKSADEALTTLKKDTEHKQVMHCQGKHAKIFDKKRYKNKTQKAQTRKRYT